MPSKLPTADKISPPVGLVSKSNWPTASVIAALSLCVALSALLRPEIEQLVKSPKIEARLADQLVLSQRVGVLWLTPFVELSNEGGKKASVRRVRMDIFGPDKLHILLNGESYLKRNSATQAYFPLVNLQIPANDQWLDRVNFREQMTQAEEESLRALMERLGKYWGLIADGPNER